MQIVLEEGLTKLIPSDSTKYLVRKDELELPVEERYYFQVAYIPATMTLEQCEEIYIETEREDNNDN